MTKQGTFFKRKPGATARANNAVLTNDPDLFFTLVAGVQYEVFADFNIDTDGDTPGFQMTFLGADVANVDGTLSTHSKETIWDDNGQVLSQQLGIWGGFSPLTVPFLTGANHVISFQGILAVTVTKVYTVQWAQLVSDAANTTVKATSYVSVRRLR